MLVEIARAAARDWVAEETRRLPNFYGAYFASSMTALPDGAPLPAASDVDIKVLVDAPDVDANPQKIVYRGVVLDISYGSRHDIATPEKVLGTYYTAAHFTHPCIIADPSGDLARIQAIVQREYARRIWVRARCEQARAQLETSLSWLTPEGPLHDQMLAWLFAVVFTPPMVLVADLRNPTHRRGLATFREVVEKYGHPELHQRLLHIVGCGTMTRTQAETLLAACADAFDVAQEIRKTPILLGSNISGFARPMAIGGGQELISDGFHREAMPWIAFIHTLCQQILHNDAPQEIRERFTPAYARLLAGLGVPAYDDIADRQEQFRQLIPDLWEVTEELLARNPAIRD